MCLRLTVIHRRSPSDRAGNGHRHDLLFRRSKRGVRVSVLESVLVAPLRRRGRGSQVGPPGEKP
jgi:hypothetical protein